MYYCFFRCHSVQLEELDDQEFDDDEETEWQHYLRSSIECIMRVADVFPDDVLQLMVISRNFFVKLISRKFWTKFGAMFNIVRAAVIRMERRVQYRSNQTSSAIFPQVTQGKSHATIYLLRGDTNIVL